MISTKGKYSLKLGSPFSIPVFLHWSAILGIGLVFAIGFPEIYTMISYVSFLVFMILGIVAHEYGHLLAAEKMGVYASHIHITIVGGFGSVDMTDVSGEMKEFWIAIAGPAISLILGTFILSLSFIYTGISGAEPFSSLASYSGEGSSELFGSLLPWTVEFWILFGAWNIAIMLFNLIPSFPTDGGRIFRSLWSQFVGKKTATKHASFLGVGLGTTLALLGVFSLTLTWILLGGIIAFMALGEYYRVCH